MKHIENTFAIIEKLIISIETISQNIVKLCDKVDDLNRRVAALERIEQGRRIRTEYDKVLDYGKMLVGLSEQIAKNFNTLCGKNGSTDEKYEESEVVNVKIYTWKDIVRIKDKLYCEEFPIKGDMFDKNTYKIGEFVKAVAEKHGIEPEEVETYMLGADISGEIMGSGMRFTTEECGCYINGVPEWEID